jgi:hypothetical protein
MICLLFNLTMNFGHILFLLGGNTGLNKNTDFLSKYIDIQTQIIDLNYLIFYS